MSEELLDSENLCVIRAWIFGILTIGSKTLGSGEQM